MRLFKIVFLLVIVLCGFLGAEISPNALKLEKLRLKLQDNNGKENCLKYLNTFPTEFKKFRDMFNCRNPEAPELCEKASAHLVLLEELSKKYTLDVIKIWFSLSKNGFWDADAVAMLRNQIVEFGIRETDIFASNLKKEKNKNGIIKFLADVRDHSDYFKYKDLLLKLKNNNQVCLYKLFIEARNERTRHWLGHDYKENEY